MKTVKYLQSVLHTFPLLDSLFYELIKQFHSIICTTILRGILFVQNISFNSSILQTDVHLNFSTDFIWRTISAFTLLCCHLHLDLKQPPLYFMESLIKLFDFQRKKININQSLGSVCKSAIANRPQMVSIQCYLDIRAKLIRTFLTGMEK